MRTSITVLLFLVIAAPALGDGLPIATSADGVSHGVTRYVALDSSRGTVVAAIRRDGAKVTAWRTLRAHAAIPAAAVDGSPTGLSADGRTLVLIRPRVRFPQPHTELTILDTARFALRRHVRLRGDYSLDAISPDGRTLFLIHYTSRVDPAKYEVRAWDGRLLPQPIVDPHERAENMRGYPMSRAVSADGRWAYTLYDGGGDTPFIHALDTTGRTARCIDMPLLRGRDLWALRLRARGKHLVVTTHGAPIALVNTRTFRAGGFSPLPPPHAEAHHGGVPWWLVAVVVTVLVGAVVLYGSTRPAQITASQASSSSIDSASRAT